MKNKFAVFFIFSAILFFGFSVNTYAALGDYLRSYDISWLEWQILNWTTAFRGTTTPAGPFILERIEYDRKSRLINIHVSGSAESATEDNLKESIDGITALFHEKFPKFDPKADLTVYYKLESEADKQAVSMVYSNGSFGSKEIKPAKSKATSY
jgi:hypothetical protein